ncbi:MAG: di-trans,poly-cis-decaprenylcistransferase [Firmicutes bacterium]|nr:di-trans,poly-cis-decaprenylcistransferase [Bacillota bacterium]
MGNIVPKHIAIIMDGNGRWAKKRLLPRVMGHKQGADALDRLLHAAGGMGIEHITVYAFSTENWKRSEEEVNGVMGILRDGINKYFNEYAKSDFRVDSLGDLSRLAPDLQADIERLKENSKNGKGLHITIAVNYGGRDELRRAVQAIAQEVKDGRLDPEDITEDTITRHLDSYPTPDPELIIRTSGEYRVSNFLIWQGAYAEYYITDKLWPDFTPEDLREAILAYQKRDRRFGGRNEG